MLKALILEFLGSLTITFTMALCRITNPSDYLIIGLSFFLLIGSLTYAFRKTSGSHFNPILTVSLLVTKQVASKKAVLYVITQIIASIVGATLVYSAYKMPEEAIEKYYGEPKLSKDYPFTASLTEFVSMFMLVYVYNTIIGNVHGPKHVYGIAIASVYLVAIISFGNMSGGCVNIITLIGPSIFSGNYGDWFLYCASQLFGGVLSGTFYSLFLRKNKTDAEDEEPIATNLKEKVY